MIKLKMPHEPIASAKLAIHRIEAAHHIRRLFVPATFGELVRRRADQLQPQIPSPIPAGAKQLLAQSIHPIQHPALAITRDKHPSALAVNHKCIILQLAADPARITQINRILRTIRACGLYLQCHSRAPLKYVAKVFHCRRQPSSSLSRHDQCAQRLQ